MFLEADAELVTFRAWPSEPVRLAWCAWLQRHGIDPNNVAMPAAISRSVEYRTIRYRAFKRGPDGKMLINAAGDAAVREDVVVQLEAVPEPFPEVDQ